MSIAPGTRFGRYEIRSSIGKGGMGEIYLAQDTELNRHVALKLLPADVAFDQKRMQRFVQEARAASALNHPSILTIYEIGRADSAYFIATEFIDGVTLRQHIANTRMKIGEVLDTAVQITGALVAAHQAGIIHRDIKPDNIMVRHDALVKVLDFGLAKLTEKYTERHAADPDAPTKAMVKTEPGAVMGTVSYMSPEQARGLDVDARTDIWSLGVVIYEMVAGRVPFEGTTATDVFVTILDREPLPLSRHRKEVPAELEWLVKKALRKERNDRYQTTQELLTDLRSLKQELEFDAQAGRFAAQRHSATAYTREPNIGPLVSKMCDRSPQVQEFTDFFVSNLKRRSGVPQIYVVRGEERECHDSLIERLIHTQIKNFAEKRWGEQKGVITFKKLGWAYEGELTELQHELKRMLFAEFDPAYMDDDLSATALSRLPALSLTPIVVIQHRIHTTRWNNLTGELTEWYLRFWADIGLKPFEQQFLIFLNIIYPRARINRWWESLLRLKRINKRSIERELHEIGGLQAEGCPRLMLKELLPPKQDEVKDWFSHHNVCDSEKIRQELSEKIFKTDDGRIADYKSMADIEHELQKIYQGYIKERGYV